MANTAIRLGYLSISSGGGGGAGFEEYANLAAFPPVGEDGTIYLANDTKKIYIWTGSAYEEVSSSEDKANRDLDNLIETSIPDGVGLNSLATSNFNIKTIDKEGSTADVAISSGDSTIAGNSGNIFVSTGNVTSGNKGNIELNAKGITANVDYNSGLVVTNPSGLSNVNISTNGFGTPDNPEILFNGVASGGVAAIQAFSRPNNNGGTTYLTSTMVYANVDGNYNGGNLNLTAGSNAFEGITAANASVSSGSVNITTSNALAQGSAADANSGNIVIQTGNKEGSGTRGYVSLSGSHINANLAQIKNVANGTDSNDAINLSQLNSAISPIEGISEIYKFYVYENNASIYADGRPGIRDTSALIRDGWYYQNSAGQKINWYFFDGNPLSSTYQGAISQGNFSAYVVMTLDSKNAKPIIALYSLPTGVGDALPTFPAHSRWVYQLSTAALAPLSAGKQYLFYTGSNPSAHPEIPHIPLDFVPAQSIGDLNPAELILTAALNSESGEPAGDVQWMVESLGVWSPSIKQEMDLRIRTVPLNTSDKIDAIYLPSYVDDVVEYANLAAFPVTGETGKIYVALDTNKIYRWSGSTYIEISPSESATWGSITGTLSSQTDLQEALDDKYDASNPAGYITLAEVPASAVTSVNTRTGDVFLTRVDVGLGDVDNTSDLDKPISTATQTALDDILDYTPADTSAWIAPVPDDVKEALDQLADRLDSGTGVTITAFEDMKEPTGFINRTDSTISFDDATRIFTIAPVGSSFSFYIKGNKFTKTTAQTVTIPDTSGSHYIYFNTSGVLVSTQVFDISIIEQDVYVSLVYWNTDTIPHSRSYFAEERHGITMDGTTHAYLHTIFGARYLSGLALGGFTIGNGSLDSHAQFTSDSGSIRDEDILHTIGAQTQIPILFRQGQLWRKKAADNFPVIYSGSAGYTGANGRLPYNQYTGGAWQLTQVSSNNFVLVHFFATNDVDNKVIGIQGIAEYGNIPAARNAASTEITTLSDLPFTEFVPIGTVIFQTNTYPNAIDARVVTVNGANYVDFRGTQLYTPAGEATEHSLLSGLADDDHIQYHTDARGDARYNLKSTGDISETSYSITNSQTSAHNITDFAFDNAIVRSFEAEVSVEIDADTDLFEKVSISGIQKSADWEISIRSLGDSTGIVFSITSAGQLQYTSLNYTGFVSGVIKFRAVTTSV